MTVTRDKPYMSFIWIPKFLIGDRSCIWSCWFKAQHQDYERMPSDFDSAKWNAEHTDLLNKLIEELEELGCELFIERQNSFRVESANSGMVVSGKPDVIAVYPDGRTVIYDAKTGYQSPAHVLQVQLYMYLLPKSNLTRWRDMGRGMDMDKRFEGAVVYPGGHQVDVPADSIDDAFVARLAAFMQKMTSDMPPRRVPSGEECRWCEIAFGDCPDRFVDVT